MACFLVDAILHPGMHGVRSNAAMFEYLNQALHTSLLQADAEEAQPLLDELNIEVLPTVQFWKQGKLLWEHRGIVALQQDLGEGAALSH